MYNYYTHTKAELIKLIRQLDKSCKVNASYSKTELVSIFAKLRKEHLNNL